jgi:sugar/nucleoside kinase (ribokinase family)
MKKIIGMGNALTDILLLIDNDIVLEQLNLPKGSMQLVDKEKSAEIFELVSRFGSKMVAGGSASNTVTGVTRLGVEAAFVGKTGRDEIGAFYKEDIEKNNVHSCLLDVTTPSGRCVVLVSPDGERTMCTYLGAAAELTPDDLSADLFKTYDIFHIEGYLVQNNELIRKAVKLAKEAGLLVSIDLASYNVVEDNLEFLQEIVSKYVDIVFANEEESRAFTGKSPREALKHIAELADIAVVKVGKEGSFIKSGNKTIQVASRLADCIDTTGAGDLYATGFLFGMARELPLDTCGKIASIVSGHVVEVLGTKLSNRTWDKINAEIKHFL